MYNDNLIKNFCKERNIKESTKQGYLSTLTKYTKFHKCNLEYLLKEAENDELKKFL